MKKKDKLVFHYTSLEGLLGIIESKSIWATNVLYMNDASELNYAKKLFKEEISRFCKENPHFKKTKNFDDSLGAFFFDILEENINRLIDSEILSFYASSFSEEKDLVHFLKKRICSVSGEDTATVAVDLAWVLI